MRDLGVALIGLVLGCLVGWFLPWWIYPWDTMDLTLAGPEEVGYLFQVFGLCIIGPIGFYAGLWMALRCLPPVVPAGVPFVKVHDPHKVVDNLD
jgi:hypothetical protein